MKTKRNLSIILLSITFMLISMLSVYSDKQIKFGTEKKYGTAYLANLGYSVILSNPIPLYNFDYELEAVSFTIKNNGYIIVNSNDLSIPEFSLKAQNPFEKSYNKLYLYNGPLQYFEKTQDEIRNIKTNQNIKINNLNKNEMNFKYKKDKINKENKYKELIKQNSTRKNNNDLMSITASGEYEEFYKLNVYLRQYDTSRYCGVDGTAILLKWVDDYFAPTMVSDLIDTEKSLTDYLVNNDYIYDGGTSAFTVVNGRKYNDYLTTTGIKGYISDHVGTYPVDYIPYTYSDIKYKIKQGNYALMVSTSAHPYPTFDNHWVLPYGYAKPVLQTEPAYLIVNDGFGNNDVYIEASDQYFRNIIYMN